MNKNDSDLKTVSVNSKNGIKSSLLKGGSFLALSLVFLLAVIFALGSLRKTEEKSMPQTVPLTGVVYSVATMNKEGEITLEQITSSEKAHNLYSVAKLFTVLAVGICYDGGLISLDDKILEVLNVEPSADRDEKWETVTVGDLLAHTVGFSRGGVLDIDLDDTSSYGTKNYLEYVLNEPLTSTQGQDYVYTDAAYYLLSLAVERVSGKTLEDFLLPVVFNVLDFSEYAWAKCPLGHTMGATGLYVRAEDFCKIGRVFAEKGSYLGETVVSEEWVELVIERQYSLSALDGGWYYKGGLYGQYLAFNVQTGEVLACSAFDENNDIAALVEKYFN